LITVRLEGHFVMAGHFRINVIFFG
jgi:hypothetical protein